MKKYKGYELIKAIEDEKIDDCIIKYKRPFIEGYIQVKEKELKWEPGVFTTKFLTDGYTQFEIIEDTIDIQKIEEVEEVVVISTGGFENIEQFVNKTNGIMVNNFYKVNEVINNQNELIRAIKQLDKKLRNRI